jgi:hypothetical protein
VIALGASEGLLRLIRQDDLREVSVLKLVALSPGKQIIALRAAEIDISITNETGELLAVGGLKETSEPNVDRRIVPDVMCASTRKILH